MIALTEKLQDIQEARFFKTGKVKMVSPYGRTAEQSIG